MKTRTSFAFLKMLRLLLLMLTVSAASAFSTPAMADYWGNGGHRHGGHGHHGRGNNGNYRNNDRYWNNDRGYSYNYVPNYPQQYYRPAPTYNYPRPYYPSSRGYYQDPYWGGGQICTYVDYGFGFIQVCD